jgi:hypothetical protein
MSVEPEQAVETVEFAGADYSGFVTAYPSRVFWRAYYNGCKGDCALDHSDSGWITVGAWTTHRAALLAALGSGGDPGPLGAPA